MIHGSFTTDREQHPDWLFKTTIFFLTKNLDLLLLFAVVSKSLSRSLSPTRRAVVVVLPRKLMHTENDHPLIDFFNCTLISQEDN
jgi:hypothetical protein